MKRFLCVGKSSRVRVHMYQKEEATLVRSIELESIVELVVSHADNAKHAKKWTTSVEIGANRCVCMWHAQCRAHGLKNTH